MAGLEEWSSFVSPERAGRNRIRLTAHCDLFHSDFRLRYSRTYETYSSSRCSSLGLAAPLSRSADARSDSPASRRRARTRVQAADDPRVQAEVAAGHAAASGAAREIPGHRHPQPSADADLARRVRPRDERDGGEQPPDPRQPERLVRRPSAPGRRCAQGQQVQGPHGPVRQHQLRRPGRPRLRREGGQAARRRPQGRGDGAEDLQGPRHVRHEGERRAPAGRRSGAGCGLGDLRAAQRAGADPHRRAAGLLRAARLHQRALARAVALHAIAATRPACASSS